VAIIRCNLQGFPSRPFVSVWTSLDGCQNRPVNFLVDTGSPYSFLSPNDVVAFGLVVDKLPAPLAPRNIASIGGIIPNHDLGVIDDYEVKFITNRGWYDMVSEDGDRLLVIKQNHGYKLPSILGVDFLTRHYLRLVLDNSRNFVELKTGSED
jgi:hypothetical protein